MRYSEIKPTARLRRFVECFWTLEGDGSVDTPAAERILPDGCVELILNFGDRFQQHFEDERRLQPRNFLVGQMTGPILISPCGAVELLGIRFQPGGTRPFVDVPAHDVTDRVVDLGDISGIPAYYDQAHLIRDFNQFAQQTPAVLFASQTPLTESFTRKARTSHFSNTAA